MMSQVRNFISVAIFYIFKCDVDRRILKYSVNRLINFEFRKHLF